MERVYMLRVYTRSDTTRRIDIQKNLFVCWQNVAMRFPEPILV